MQEWIGKTIGKVRIEKYLTRGGMAEVYFGTHLTLDRPVAVKVLHSFIEDDPGLLARFQREARVVAGLRHNNIVQIFDFDTEDGHPYIVMEYIAGPSLAVYLRSIHERGVRLAYTQVTRLLMPLAAALDYAHTQGVIHRDVKPANILLHAQVGEFTVNSPLTESVEPVITDFGLVRIVHSAIQTTTGAVSGTPAYMSPEQARGDKVDHRTDIYSFGVVLYEMLAGRVPFEADSTMSVLYMHINAPPPPIEGIHPSLRAVVERALAKNPDDRYQTCRELASDFVRAIEQNSQLETVGKPLISSLLRASQTVEAVETQEPAKGRNWKRIIGLGLGALVLCFCGLAVAQRLSQRAATATPSPTEPPVATEVETIPPTEEPTAVPVVFPPAADGIPVGVLRFQDGAAALDQVTVFASLAAPPEGSQYEGWLVGDGGELRRTLGLLAQDETGQFVLTYVDSQSRNLMDRFNRMEITLGANHLFFRNPT